MQIVSNVSKEIVKDITGLLMIVGHSKTESEKYTFELSQEVFRRTIISLVGNKIVNISVDEINKIQNYDQLGERLQAEYSFEQIIDAQIIALQQVLTEYLHSIKPSLTHEQILLITVYLESIQSKYD